MTLEKNSDSNGSNMPYVYKMFYNVKLKDYFAMLALFVDGVYNSEYNVLSLYSDADEQYMLRKGFEIENAEINPDAAIGDMISIARRLMTCDYGELEDPPCSPVGMNVAANYIIKGIMITPFYDMFCTDKGRKAFEEITNTKSI